MKTRLFTPRGLVFASILAVTLSFDDSHAQEFGYDDDNQLDFVWTAPEGSFDHYNVYVSVDGGVYQMEPGHPSTEACTVAGDNGHIYRVKVSAVTAEGVEGPSSPESDPVICDTLAPLSPVISGTFNVLDQNTVVLSLESAPTDANFSNYQVLGGSYTDWTDTPETTTFVFAVDPDSQNTLQIREKDLAGNMGPADSLTVENLSGDNDSDGIPNYWELMYSGILDPDNPADATIDSDGDGWSNYEEFVGGTDPTEPGSAPSDTTPPTISGCTGNTAGVSGESVTISATLSDNVGVTKAWLYYKTASASTWIPLDFVSGSASVSIPGPPAEDIYYYITADDAAGNGPVGDPSADGSLWYTISVDTVSQTQTLYLEEGWNLVGISHQPLDPSCSAIFGDVAVGSIWGWDGSKNFQVTSVEPLRAYWVLTTGPAAVQYDYVSVSDPTPDLTHPWNVFAVAEETPLPLPYPDVVGSVWGWDGTKYVRMETSLQPHEGYWVAADAVSKSAPVPLEAPAVGDLLNLRVNMQLAGVDKGFLEIGLFDTYGDPMLEPSPPASPDGFNCYILGGGTPPFKCVSKKLSVLSQGEERHSWHIIAHLPGRKEFSLSWDRSVLPPYAVVTITEVNTGDATPKGGSLSMSETDRMSCLPSYSSVLAWKVEATCRARPSQDADSDLIADDWERQNFGTITCDPADDPDQDGMSNYAEFVAGTSPNNRAAVLTITDICEVVGGEGAVLSWESVLGRKYQVLYRDSLGDGEWCCLGEEIVGTGGTMLIPDSAVHSNLSKRFYRVRVW